MKKPLKIGAYMRVSTDKQVQVFEGSLETQKFRMQEFVKNRNRENKNWGHVVDFYVEEGLSAETDKRPQYQRLMSDVRSGKINLILVADISRLSRSTHDFSVLLRELEAYNASYLSMKEQFDTSTPAGRLMINLVVNMAQFEREQISERVSINCNSRALRGYVNGGRIPYGFDKHSEKSGILVINEEEAKNIKTIFEVFKEQGSIGKSLPVIEALGIVPDSKSEDLLRSKRERWNYTYIRDLLTNVAYVGKREVNKKRKGMDEDNLKPWQKYQIVKASWPAIIPQELFDEVQIILQENASMERRRLANSTNRIFLLSGVLCCGECGRPLNGQTAHGKKAVHRYYYHSYKRGEKITCNRKRIRADDIEQVVINHLVEVVGRAGYFDEIEEKISQALEDNPRKIEEEVKKAEELLTATEKEISSTFKFHSSAAQGTDASQIALEHLEKLGAKKRILKQRLVDLESRLLDRKDPKELREILEERIKAFRRGFWKASMAERRRLLRYVLQKLVLVQQGLDVSFQFEENNQSRWVPSSESAMNVIPLKAKKSPGSVLSGSEANLSLSSACSLNDWIGWGSRT